MSGSGGLADRLVQAAADVPLWERVRMGDGIMSSALKSSEEVAREMLPKVLTLLIAAVDETWRGMYPGDVFLPLSVDEARAYHRAFAAAGLSVDRWSAHVVQAGYRAVADLLRVAAVEVRDGQ